jgi:hypothetical protein
VSYDPTTRSIPELLKDWGAIMRELRVRDVIRTNNNPVGDIAEAIVATHYGGERGTFAQAGWDVRLPPSSAFPQGERIQVKAMRQTPAYTRTTLSPIRDQDYDTVLIVILDEGFVVMEGLRVSQAVVNELFQYKPYVNGYVINVTKKFRADSRVERVELAEAARRLHA